LSDGMAIALVEGLIVLMYMTVLWIHFKSKS
jgi:hypothetical protein